MDVPSSWLFSLFWLNEIHELGQCLQTPNEGFAGTGSLSLHSARVNVSNWITQACGPRF